MTRSSAAQLIAFGCVLLILNFIPVIPPIWIALVVGVSIGAGYLTGRPRMALAGLAVSVLLVVLYLGVVEHPTDVILISLAEGAIAAVATLAGVGLKRRVGAT
jgi:hypothetical protein